MNEELIGLLSQLTEATHQESKNNVILGQLVAGNMSAQRATLDAIICTLVKEQPTLAEELLRQLEQQESNQSKLIPQDEEQALLTLKKHMNWSRRLVVQMQKK